MAKKTVGGWLSRPKQTPESRLARILRTVGDDEETCQNLIDQIKARFEKEKLLQVCPSDWWVEHEATHHIIAIAVEKGKELKNEEEAGYIPHVELSFPKLDRHRVDPVEGASVNHLHFPPLRVLP